MRSLDLASSDAQTCRSYFAWQGPVQHVLLHMHGTGLGSNAFIPSNLAGLVEEHAVAHITFDRPGVSAPFGKPQAVTYDDQALEQVTQGQLLACARSALHEQARLLGEDSRIHLRGQSEGALLALMLYEELLRSDPELAARIDTLILSGTPVEPFAEVFQHQLDLLVQRDGSAIAEEVQRCDWRLMRARFGLSCAYLQDADARPSGRTLFERLAELRAPASFHIFHGESDWNTPIEPVRELEHWARQQPLDITFVYYDGGHNRAPEAARSQVTELVWRVTAAPSTSSASAGHR